MKRALPVEVNQLPGRANSKGVTVMNRHYIVGGLSSEGPEMNIYSFELSKTPNKGFEVKWRQQKVKGIEIFTPRNSYALATDNNKIYIFGGSRMDVEESTDQLLVYTPGTNLLDRVQTVGTKPPALNSATLNFDEGNGCLVLFGGISSKGKFPLGLYRLHLKTLEWTFQETNLECYQEGIWQHTAHIVNYLLKIQDYKGQDKKHNANKIVQLDLGIKFQPVQPDLIIKKVNIGENLEVQPSIDQDPQQCLECGQPKPQSKGPFLVVVGGCSHPNHPYSQVTQIDLTTGTIASQAFVSPITGHQSVIYNDFVFIFGGSDGSDLTQTIVIAGPNSREEKGFTGIGPVGFTLTNGILIYGGIDVTTSPPKFNNVQILYDDQ